MPDDVEPVRVPIGHDAQVGVVVDEGRGVDQYAIHSPGERRFRQARADAGSDLRHGNRFVEAFLATIGKCNYGHGDV